jgi:PAS domain S-box-containing protein/putative nucleotidyltransferase with HDIG domain
MDDPVEELRILMLEDTLSDAELEKIELRGAGLLFTSLRVDTREAFERALDEFKPGIILADYRLPTYNGSDALEYARRTHPQIPVIMVTGAMGDETAVELLKLGAKDYVLKDSLVRLAPAVKRALSEEIGIRNRKLAERMRQESELRYRRLFEAAKDGILILDAETGQIVDANPYILDLLSYSLSESIGKKLWEIGLFSDSESCKNAFKKLQTTGHIRYENLPLESKGGQRRDVEFVSNVYEVGDRKVIQCNIRDITERLRAAQALRESEARYKRITEGLTDYQYTVRIENGNAVETAQSPACVMVTGYTAEEFAADSNLWIQMVAADDQELVVERVKEALSGKEVPPMEHRIIRKDGVLRWVSDTIILFKDASGKLLSYDGVIRDITERKLANQIIREEKAFSDTLIQGLPDIFYLLDRQDGILRWNSKLAELTGRSPEEMPGANAMAFIHEEDRPFVTQQLQVAFETGSAVAEARLVLTNGIRYYVLTATRIETPRGMNVIGIGVDITERKNAEDALYRANRALKTLSAGNLALVRASNEDELLRAVTNVIVETGGYLMAWVGYAEDDAAKTVRPVAQSGYEEGYLETVRITWADTERGQGPTGTAIREVFTVFNQDVLRNPKMAPWREDAIKRGYRSSIAIPLVRIDRVLGALTIYSTDPLAFNAEEVKVLEELASDLAFGIETMRTRLADEQHSILLRQSLEQSIQTIAGTVEARDPYTAGHQRRVGELATAIAREMGLPYEQVNGIHLAAIIHDLGKVNIPAEILSKPGKLSDIEFLLIKSHPQIGYDILKDVKFPWPIADIVLQHHEKLDGSGYPQGLKGGQILLESRIMTVADVVEAMSSHRPYRSALGIEAALHEIERGRGRLYDPAVVDACIHLFAKKGFTFSS